MEDKPEIPDYVCCVVTESVWTWFLTIVFSVMLFAIATLRYCKRHLGSEQYADKNQNLLARQLIEYGREALGILRVAPVPEAEFLKYCALRRRHSAVIDKLEFAKTLKFDDDKKAIIHEMSKNISSVSLKNLQSVNWILGRFEDDRSWIVTEGPKEKTAVNFWLTVWEQETPVIVMLSKTFEIVKMICLQYWPNHPGSEQVYGDLIVTLVKESTYAHYKVRHLLVRRGLLKREVRLFQYLDWPASAHPDTTSLLHFRRRVHECLSHLRSGGPAMIHCQSSKRRSGTFLAIEYTLTGRERTGSIDILGTVRWLRCQNPNLISTPEQYHFIYELVEDCILCGDTRVQNSSLVKSQLSSMVSTKSVDESMEKLDGGLTESQQYENEYVTLCSLPHRLTMGDCAAGHRPENREKNRNVLNVPPDEWRPYLTSFQGSTDGDYINAVFVDGFKTEREFIAAEWPFSHTAANFWSMIYDHDVAAVVVLNNPPSKLLVVKNYIDFWPQALANIGGKYYPEDTVKQFGPVFSVEVVSREDKLDGDIGIWELKICKKEIAPHRKTQSMNVDEKQGSNITSLSNLLLGISAPSKIVKLLQIRKSWPQNQTIPDSTTPMLQIMQEVEAWRNFKRANCNFKKGETEQRVAVISCDGISRIGMYCTAVHSMEKAVDLGHFDVFQSAKSVRRSRPQLIENVGEYKFCYELVKEFVKENCN